MTERFYVRFDGPPSHESGRFIEVETEDGLSVSPETSGAGWYLQDDDTWLLGPFGRAPVPAPEQQGEPVCEACARPQESWIHEPCDIDHMPDGECAYHPFEPSAPPSSEEAGQRDVGVGENPDYDPTVTEEESRAHRRVLRWYGAMVAGDFYADIEAYRAAIRSPLEERVRELEGLLATPGVQFLTEQAHKVAARNRIQALEEERDRLRGLLQSMHAAGEVDGRNALIARAEAAEAQVAELREALERVRNVMHLPRAEDAANRAVDVATEALLALAETVQEGGETQ